MKRNDDRILAHGLCLVAVLAIGVFGCNVLSGASDLTTNTDSETRELTESKAGTLPGAEKTTQSANETGSATTENGDGQKGSGTGAGTGSGSGTGATTDAGPTNNPVVDNPVECGAVTCHGGEAACCVGGGQDLKTCTTKTANTCQGALIECGGRSNCGTGEICCLTLVNGQAAAKCAAEGSCGGSNQVMFCRDATDCLAGQHCVQTQGSFADHHGCI